MQIKFGKIKINKSILKKEVARNISISKKLSDTALRQAEKRAEESHQELLKQFDAHAVTKEIEAGAGNTVNFSNTLKGIGAGEGSLFGFIGFNAADAPILLVREYLKSMGKVAKRPKKTIRGTRVSFEYKVSMPNMRELEMITPMPWEGGRSWVRAVERGISGLGYYLLSQSAKSRSGQGLQATNKLRNAAYRPTKYMSSLLKNYANQLRTGKIRRTK